MALLAILARVRRRLRTLAAIEGAAWAGALALGLLALGVGLARWRAGSFPAHPLRLALAAAGLTCLARNWSRLRRRRRCRRHLNGAGD